MARGLPVVPITIHAMTSPHDPLSGPGTGSATGSARLDIRLVAAWTLLGYTALRLFFAFLAWVVPDGSVFSVRSASASFADLFAGALPLVAVALAVWISPTLADARRLVGRRLDDFLDPVARRRRCRARRVLPLERGDAGRGHEEMRAQPLGVRGHEPREPRTGLDGELRWRQPEQPARTFAGEHRTQPPGVGAQTTAPTPQPAAIPLRSRGQSLPWCA